MTKELNISYHLDGYSVSVNNCLDYNIAGAASFYNKYFLKLYCSIWSICVNYIDCPHENLSNYILDLLGLKMEKVIYKKNSIISQIKTCIDCKYPLLFYTNTSLLFYSLMYLLSDSNNVNHSFIINGYDDEKKLLFIKENIINPELLRTITNVQPFSSYKFTYDIFLNIFNETHNSLNGFDLLFCIKKERDININELKRQLLFEYLNLLKKQEDCLLSLLNYLIVNKEFPQKNYGEQFYRDYYHSYSVIFDFILDNFYIKDLINFQKIKTKYMDYRKDIVMTLSKQFIIKKINDYNNIINLKNGLMKLNNELYDFINLNYIKAKSEITINKEDFVIIADSIFSEKFSQNNIIKEEFLNNKTSFWRSANTVKNHWIKIEFYVPKKINGIYIEHHSSNAYITSDYDIFLRKENKYKLFKRIKNNKEVINEFVMKNLTEVSGIKILVKNPNAGVDYSGRIRRINFL